MYRDIEPVHEPFLITRASEWQWLRSPDMTVSTSVRNGQGLEYPEEARTGGALYVQQQLHSGSESSWQELTAAQTASRLMPPEYLELHMLSQRILFDPEAYEAMQYINLVHDIPKNPEIMHAVGLNSATDSHDDGMRRLFLPQHQHLQARFLPSLANPRMFNDRQRYLIEGVLTTEFNFARFCSAETSSKELERLEAIDPDILSMAVLHGIHDIGGALGHKSLVSSLTLDSHTAVRLLDAAYALLGSAEDLGLGPVATVVTPAQRQTAYLQLRARRLGIQLQKQPSFVDILDARARIRIANFLRCDTPEDFAPVEAAYNRLPFLLQAPWKMDILAETIGTEYAPAFIRTVADEGSSEAMYVALGYFSQALLQVATAGAWEASQTNRSWAEMVTYNQINFYHLVRWFTENKDKGGETIHVIWRLSGRTVTPVPVDPRTYDGPEQIWPLNHPDAYDTTPIQH
jgi:hypothetical protein